MLPYSDLKLCMLITSVELHTFVPVLVTMAHFNVTWKFEQIRRTLQMRVDCECLLFCALFLSWVFCLAIPYVKRSRPNDMYLNSYWLFLTNVGLFGEWHLQLLKLILKQAKLLFLDEDWRKSLSLLIEKLQERNYDLDVTCSIDKQFKVNVALLEAARRLSFTEEVEIISTDERIKRCVTYVYRSLCARDLLFFLPS